MIKLRRREIKLILNNQMCAVQISRPGQNKAYRKKADQTKLSSWVPKWSGRGPNGLVGDPNGLVGDPNGLAGSPNGLTICQKYTPPDVKPKCVN